MSERSEYQRKFILGFTGKDVGLNKKKKPKKHESEREARERQRKMNERIKRTGK